MVFLSAHPLRPPGEGKSNLQVPFQTNKELLSASPTRRSTYNRAQGVPVLKGRDWSPLGERDFIVVQRNQSLCPLWVSRCSQEGPSRPTSCIQSQWEGFSEVSEFPIHRTTQPQRRLPRVSLGNIDLRICWRTCPGICGSGG